MRQLAMRAVDLAPGLKQLKDRRDLLGAQAVHRVSAGPLVLKASGIAPASPPPRPTLIQLQIGAGAPMLPPVSERAVDHAQQLLLGGLIDPAGDPATQSQRPFPGLLTFPWVFHRGSDGHSPPSLSIARAISGAGE